MCEDSKHGPWIWSGWIRISPRSRELMNRAAGLGPGTHFENRLCLLKKKKNYQPFPFENGVKCGKYYLPKITNKIKEFSPAIFRRWIFII